jgi:hypothetical protein
VANISWTWLSIRATGVTAWGLLSAVVIWGLLLQTQILGRLASPMRLLDLHRWLGAIAVGFVVVHMVLLMVDSFMRFSVGALLIPGWQQPLACGLRGDQRSSRHLWADCGQDGPESGRSLIAYAAWPFATAHYVLAGTDALAEWSLALLFAGTALIVMGLLARGFIPAPGPQREITGKPTLTSS